MKTRLTAAAARLEGGLSLALRRQLATDPLGALRDMRLRVVELQAVATSETCSVDGAYFPAPYSPLPTIGYVPTPRSRRENFTLLHELGHHLIRLDDELLSRIADEDDRDLSEERICDAFAGRVLVPDEVVLAVLNGRRPEAADLRKLYEACRGSREACAVRLAEQLRCDGYVVLLERDSRTVRFASSSPERPYAWGRGSPIPIDHPVWRAGSAGSFRGEGEVVWRSRYRRNFWLDAVGDGPLVLAVFAADRYWKASGLGILSDPSQTRATPILFSGTCRHCGAGVYGTRACEKCGDVTCRKCGKCGCGAPAPLVKICTKCHMMKGKAQFRPGSSVCRECDAP
jgi:hypothetical protein